MDKLVLVGGGGHCKSVLDSVIKNKLFSDIVIVDAEIKPGTKILGVNVVGDDSALCSLKEKGFNYAFVSVGSIKDSNLRKQLLKKILDIGYNIPIIVDPTSNLSDSAKIGLGTFIGKNVIINAGAEIGCNCIINTGSVIEHDCTVGDFSHISVGTILCGNVRVGNNCFVGAGSTVIQGVNIGDHVIIGANSTVLSNVLDYEKVYGVVNHNI